MRRPLLLFVIVAAVALVVAGPVKTGFSKELKGEVTWWSGGYIAKVAKELLQDFLKEHPGVKVEVVGYPYAKYITKMRVAVASGSPKPDIMVIHSHWIRPFIEGGHLVDLTDKIESIGYHFVPSILPGITDAEGRIYGLSRAAPVHVFWYRKDVYDKYGLTSPKNVDELISIGKKLKERGVFIGTFDSVDGDILRFQFWLAQLGGNIFDQQGQVILDRPEGKGIQVAKLIKQLVDAGIFLPITNMAATPPPDYWKAFKEGIFVSDINGSWYPAHILRQGFPPDMPGYGNWRVTEAPVLEKGGNTTAIWTGAYGTISKYSTEKELAWEVLKYMMANKETLVKKAHLDNTLPGSIEGLKAIVNSPGKWPFFGEQPVDAFCAKLILTEKPPTLNTPLGMTEAREIVKVEIARMLAGELTPEEAIKTAAEKIRKTVR